MRIFLVCLFWVLGTACSYENDGPHPAASLAARDADRALRFDLGDQVFIRCSGPERSQIVADTRTFIARRVQISVGERAVVANNIGGSIRSRFGPKGSSFGLRGSYFDRIQLFDRFNNELAHDTDFILAPEGALFQFDGRLPFEAGSDNDLSLVLGIAPNQSFPGTFVGHWYDVQLGSDWRLMNFIYTDTGEPVPSHRTSITMSCWDVREGSFFIRSDQPDLRVMRDPSFRMPIAVPVPATRVVTLRGKISNQGSVQSIIRGFTIQGVALTDEDTPIPWSTVARRCQVALQQGTTSVAPDANAGLRVTVSGLTLRPGSGECGLTVTCDYEWPAGINARLIQVRAAVQGDSFDALGQSGEPQVSGDLVIDDPAFATAPGFNLLQAR